MRIWRDSLFPGRPSTSIFFSGRVQARCTRWTSSQCHDHKFIGAERPTFPARCPPRQVEHNRTGIPLGCNAATKSEYGGGLNESQRSIGIHRSDPIIPEVIARDYSVRWI